MRFFSRRFDVLAEQPSAVAAAGLLQILPVLTVQWPLARTHCQRSAVIAPRVGETHASRYGGRDDGWIVRGFVKSMGERVLYFFPPSRAFAISEAAPRLPHWEINFNGEKLSRGSSV